MSAGDLARDAIIAVARKTPDVGSVQTLAIPTVVRDRKARSVRFPAVADEDLTWWAGLYVGDGYVHNRGTSRCVEFAIPGTQPDLRDELARVTRDLFSIEMTAPDEWRVRAPGIRLVDFVETIGLKGSALEKRVPRWVFGSPEDQRLAFLGGYVDADGLVRTGASKDMGATSANAELLEDVRHLAIGCGIRTTRIWTFHSRHPHEPTRLMTGYRMQFSGDFDRITCRALQRTTRMRKRKWVHNYTSVKNTPLTAHTSAWLGFARVVAVSPEAPARCFAIQAAEPGALVAEGLLIHV